MLALKETPLNYDLKIYHLWAKFCFVVCVCVCVWYFSWVVYCDYSRRRRWLISVLLTQMWPGLLLSRNTVIGSPSNIKGPRICLSFRFLWFLLCGLLEEQNPLCGNITIFLILFSSFFKFIIPRFGLLAGIRLSVCISKFQRILCVSFIKMVLICVYTIWQYGEISISCTIPCESSFSPSHV